MKRVAHMKNVSLPTESVVYTDGKGKEKTFNSYDLENDELIRALVRRKITHLKSADVDKPERACSIETLRKMWR